MCLSSSCRSLQFEPFSQKPDIFSVWCLVNAGPFSSLILTFLLFHVRPVSYRSCTNCVPGKHLLNKIGTGFETFFFRIQGASHDIVQSSL